MSDIVKRLRAIGAERQRTTAHDNPDHYLHVVAKISNTDGTLMQNAADEIERLQAECWRMKEDLDRAIGWRDRDYDLVQELKAQVHELKTALKQAANALDDWGGYVAANNARAALEDRI